MKGTRTQEKEEEEGKTTTLNTTGWKSLAKKLSRTSVRLINLEIVMPLLLGTLYVMMETARRETDEADRSQWKIFCKWFSSCDI